MRKRDETYIRSNGFDIIIILTSFGSSEYKVTLKGRKCGPYCAISGTYKPATRFESLIAYG